MLVQTSKAFCNSQPKQNDYMAPNKASSFIFLSSLTLLLFIARAQDRAPHGLVYENPVAFSPSAVEFFHPRSQEPEASNPCAASSSSSSCSPLPVAAQVEATKAQEAGVSASQNGGGRLGAGAIVGIVFVSAFVVLLAMGAYYVLITRRANISRAKSVQPDA